MHWVGGGTETVVFSLIIDVLMSEPSFDAVWRLGSQTAEEETHLNDNLKHKHFLRLPWEIFETYFQFVFE